MDNSSNLTIREISEGLKNKNFSAKDLAKDYLNRIKKSDENIHAYLSLDADGAILQAKEIDDKISKGEDIDSLAGVPCAVKDVIMVEGLKCTAGSKILENYVAPYDATAVKKLKEKRVLILGKTNLDEFAMGSSTENSAFGATKNPLNLTRVPGGSSGGSAAAVAEGTAVFALGSDTGGSIRQPASFCGVVGLKPTYGAVSRHGLIAYASSLDQIGPIANTVDDCEIVFGAIKGKDSFDSTSVETEALDRLAANPLEDLVIGVPKEYFAKGIDPEIERIIKSSIKKYETAGAKIEEVNLPRAEYALACYYIIATSEASANLARFDGMRYGYSEAQSEKCKAKNLLEVYLHSKGEGFGREVRRRIMLGTYSLSSGYYEAYYLRAQKIRTLIKQDFEKAFERADVLMAPVSPFPAFKIGEKIQDPLSMYLSDIYTISINLAGLPALSLPVAKTSEGLPVGLQIIGKHFQESKIFEVARIFEKI